MSSSALVAYGKGALLTPLELAPAADAVIGDNGFEEVQQGALVDAFVLTDLNGPSGVAARLRLVTRSPV